MANKLDIMDLKQMINLHTDGTSNRQISLILGLSRNTSVPQRHSQSTLTEKTWEKSAAIACQVLAACASRRS
jgi:hypothetical protein